MTTNTKRAYKLRILVNLFRLFRQLVEFFLGGALCLFDRSIATVAFVLLAGRFYSANIRGSLRLSIFFCCFYLACPSLR